MRVAAAWFRALAILALLGGCAVFAEDDDPTATERSGPVLAELADHCPPVDTPIAFPPDGLLPDGAVGVRLCNGVEIDQGEYQYDVQPPADELTTDVAALVDLVNAMPELAPHEFCPADGGPGLVFWFRYPDGRARAVRYSWYGCRDVQVSADERRVSGEDLHVAFAQQLAEQRNDLTPALDLAQPTTCPPDLAPTTALDLVPALELEVAVVCRDLDGHVGWEAVEPLSPQQVSDLNESWSPDTMRDWPGCSATPFVSITGYTAWGDFVSLSGKPCRLEVPTLRRPPDGFAGWAPPPEIVQMLRGSAEH